MPAPTREQVWAALEAQLLTLKPSTFKTVSRVWKHWADEARPDQPALYIVETGETHAQEKGTPSLRSLRGDLVLYANRGDQPDVVASTTLNALLDAIEGALKPDPLAGADTLGGLVSHAWITDVEIIEGTLQDQATVVVGIELLLNQDATAPAQTFLFDVGALWATGTRRADGTAITGNAIAPARLAALKDTDVRFLGDLTFSRSTMHYALDAGWSARQILGRARFATFDSLAVEQFFFGRSAAAGSRHADRDAAYTVAPITFQVTVTPPGGGTYAEDLGVFYDATGGALVRRESGAPAAGEYTNVTGSPLYTFNAADVGKVVRISSLYTLTTGKAITLSNAFQQLAPTMRAVLYGRYNDKQMTLILNRCVTSSLLLPTSTEQFAVPEFEFEALADAAGIVGTLNLA